MKKGLNTAFEATCRVCMFLSSVLVLLAILLTFIQVVLRFAFFTAIPWAEESIRYGILAAMCLGIPCTAKSDKLPRVDLFFNRLSPRAQYYFNYLFGAAMVGITGVVVWQGVRVTLSRVEMGAVTIRMSMAVPYAFIPICGLLLMFAAVVKMVNNEKPAEK